MLTFNAGQIRPSGEIVLSFSDNGFPFLTISDVSYVVATRFIFPGSDITGDLIKFESITRDKNGPSNEYDIRLFDLSNSNVIATISVTVSDDEFSIVKTTDFINVPSGEAMFEMQGKTDGNSEIEISTISLMFG